MEEESMYPKEKKFVHWIIPLGAEEQKKQATAYENSQRSMRKFMV